MNGTFDLDFMLSAGNADNGFKQISVDMLVPYHNHKFTLYEGDRLNDMVESIRTNGVLVPIVVQPAGSGKYEILIGHNRWNASVIAGKKTVPAIIKPGLTEDEAEMYVIESNLLQRGFDNLRISEQASVIAMRYSKMFSEDKRNEIVAELEALQDSSKVPQSVPVSSTRKVGAEYAMSKNSVARLIRISKLCDELKTAIDEGVISIRAGVELSYLDDESQKAVSELLKTEKIDMKKASEIRSAAGENGSIDINSLKNLYLAKPKPKQEIYKIQKHKIRRFFSEDAKSEEIEEIIERALEMYFSGAEEGKQ